VPAEVEMAVMATMGIKMSTFMCAIGTIRLMPSNKAVLAEEFKRGKSYCVEKPLRIKLC
jgi:hypothetical protein